MHVAADFTVDVTAVAMLTVLVIVPPAVVR